MRILRNVFLVAVGLYFLVPLLAMARFAFQSVPVVLLTPRIQRLCNLPHRTFSSK